MNQSFFFFFFFLSHDRLPISTVSRNTITFPLNEKDSLQNLYKIPYGSSTPHYDS